MPLYSKDTRFSQLQSITSCRCTKCIPDHLFSFRMWLRFKNEYFYVIVNLLIAEYLPVPHESDNNRFSKILYLNFLCDLDID